MSAVRQHISNSVTFKPDRIAEINNSVVMSITNGSANNFIDNSYVFTTDFQNHTAVNVKDSLLIASKIAKDDISINDSVLLATTAAHSLYKTFISPVLAYSYVPNNLLLLTNSTTHTDYYKESMLASGSNIHDSVQLFNDPITCSSNSSISIGNVQTVIDQYDVKNKTEINNIFIGFDNVMQIYNTVTDALVYGYTNYISNSKRIYSFNNDYALFNIPSNTAYILSGSIAFYKSYVLESDSLSMFNSQVGQFSNHDFIESAYTCALYNSRADISINSATNELNETTRLAIWENTLTYDMLPKTQFMHVSAISNLTTLRENTYYIVG